MPLWTELEGCALENCKASICPRSVKPFILKCSCKSVKSNSRKKWRHRNDCKPRTFSPFLPWVWVPVRLISPFPHIINAEPPEQIWLEDNVTKTVSKGQWQSPGWTAEQDHGFLLQLSENPDPIAVLWGSLCVFWWSWAQRDVYALPLWCSCMEWKSAL